MAEKDAPVATATAGGPEAGSGRLCTLISQEGDKFDVDMEVAQMSVLVKEMTDDDEDQEGELLLSRKRRLSFRC